MTRDSKGVTLYMKVRFSSFAEPVLVFTGVDGVLVHVYKNLREDLLTDQWIRVVKTKGLTVVREEDKTFVFGGFDIDYVIRSLPPTLRTHAGEPLLTKETIPDLLWNNNELILHFQPENPERPVAAYVRTLLKYHFGNQWDYKLSPLVALGDNPPIRRIRVNRKASGDSIPP